MRILAGRYTLEDRVLDGPGWSYWRAVDGVLHRAVGVLALDDDDPRTEAVVAGARAAALVEDPRIQRVLDILAGPGGTCLVMEWNVGTSLEELLATGPLPDAEGARIVLEAARSLAGAEPLGLVHGRPTPRWVLRTEDGRVRVLAFGIARELDALAEPGGADPDARSDAWYLGALLYAALTGRWPGEPTDCALPSAPRQAGRPVRPSRVLAGVPFPLDDVCARALGLPGRGAPLQTASAVAAALEAATRRVLALPVDELDQPRRSAGRVIVAAAAVILTVIGSLGYLALRSDENRPIAPVAGPTVLPPAASSSPEPPSGPVPIVSARDFDPDGNGTENPDLVHFAIDGNPTTSWHTLVYTTALLGGLKPGVGLLLDLGAKTRVAAVQVELSGPGTSLELRVADRLSESASDYFTVAAAQGAVDVVTLAPAAKIEARYLLVWLTKLPAVNGGFQGTVRDIQVFRN